MKNKIIYYSIEFNENGKTYFYNAKDKEYHINDYVVVPVNDTKIPKIGKIVKINYFTESNAPIPIDEIKTIQRLCFPCEVEDYLSMLKTGKWAEKAKKDNPTISRQPTIPKTYKPKTQAMYHPIKPKRVAKSKSTRKKKSFLGKMFKGVFTIFAGILAGMAAAGKSKPKRYRQKWTGYPKGETYHFTDKS